MSEQAEPAALETELLLSQYNFDLGSQDLARLIVSWLHVYPPAWLRLAAIEALYQGRYKAISVEQILAVWQRRGKPLPHFNPDFERMICSRLAPLASPAPAARSLPSWSEAGPAQSFTPAETIEPYHPPATQTPAIDRLTAAQPAVIVARFGSPQPIDRFVPDPAASGFYTKLRSVAQQPNLLEESIGEAAS